MNRSAAAFLVASFLVCACTKGGGNIATDRLSIALPINPTQLNGILAQNSSENFVDGLIYSLLVTIDENGNQVPDLAEAVPTQRNGGISKNGLTVTYHLRKNVKWHDGVPFTSKDVQFTWAAIMNPQNNVISRHGFDQVASVQTPDDFTVVFHMKRAFPPMTNIVFGEGDTVLRILPQHLLAKYSSLNQIPFNSAPVGTGPYKFARWERGAQIVLAANEEYFKGAPAIKQLNLKIVLDTNTTQSQLRSHESQLGIEITAPTYAQLANASGLTRQLVPSPAYESVLLNTARPPLDDVRVRRAIGLAIDRRSLIETDTHGIGTLAVADLSPFYRSAFDPGLKPLPYDPTQARQLLEAAGWKPGADGIRVKNGQRLSLQFVYGQGSDSGRNASVEIQQMLKPVGIDMQFKSYDYATLFATAQAGGILQGGKFDMSFYAWIAGA
ncbi:MAG: peptide ABC transporter substrate-binding protein, partial [Candidatus Baltobacteraceae bacterium]